MIDQIEFEFGQPSRDGKREVTATFDGRVLARQRFDVLQQWQCKPFLEKLALAIPGAGFQTLEDAIYALEGEFIPEVNALPAENSVTALPLPTREIICAKPFPVHVLPGAVGEFVSEAAAAIGCAASFVALPTLACLARAIGNSRTIKLKDGWTEPGVIWAAIVGKSGTHKSPARKSATEILQRKQAEAIRQHEEKLRNFEQERALYDREYAVWKRGKSTEPPPQQPPEPALQRYIVSDITIEALADRLHRQFDGVLVDRDELAGWLGGIAEYKGGKGSDLGHWLASWSAEPLIVDRKTGAIKTVHVPRAAVSLVGGIPPGVLRAAIGREHMQDGLCARLLLAMPEPKPVKWTDATASPATKAAIAKVFDRLLALEPAADDEGKPAPFAMSLTSEAKSVWVEFYNRHRAEQVDLDDDLAAAWSKLEAYAARFALIFQLCSWAADEASGDDVDEMSIKAGIVLSDWFGNEARRVYGVLSESDKDREHRELIELIRRKGGRITARELAHSASRYRAAGDAEAALESLIKAGLGRWEAEPTTGRTRTVFVLAGYSGNGNTSPEFADENDPFVTVTSVTSPPTHDGNSHDADAANRQFDEAVDERTDGW